MNVISLDAPHDARLALYFDLTNHELAHEGAHGVVIAESEKVIRVALEQGLTPRSFVMEPKRLERYTPLIEAYAPEAPVYVVPHEALSQTVGFNVTRGVFAAFEEPPARTVTEVLAGAKRVALVEAVTDTTNVGALMRSAAALGADAVILDPTCANPYTRRACRVSMGSVFLVPWARAEEGAWPAATFDLMRKEGFFIAAAALDPNGYRLDDPALAAHEKLALVFGTEGEGLSKETLALVDASVEIPMAHQVDSLNVAAASAVFFWELFARGR
jgi:tRNA G18 (ribose-2'-O)-methylase SpoU